MPKRSSGTKRVPSDGYLREWLMLGSFAGKPTRLLQRQYIPEQTIVPSNRRKVSGLTWTPLKSKPRIVNLLTPAAAWKYSCDCCAYAHIYLHTAKAVRAILSIGSDDGAAIWLNGRLLYLIDIKRDVVPDQDRIACELNAGWNRLLIKIQQYDGGWGFCTRFLTPGGLSLQGLTYTLDNPLSRKWPIGDNAIPLSVSVPQISEGRNATQVQLSVHNLGTRSTPPARLLASHASGKQIRQVSVPSLAPGARAVIAVSVPTSHWARAFQTPIELAVYDETRRLSTIAEVSPDIDSAFVAAVKTAAPAIPSAHRKQLARLSADLATASEFFETRADAAKIAGVLTRAVLSRDFDSIPPLVEALLDIVDDEKRRVGKQSVHLVGHAHIDMNWLWRWPETIQVCIDTFRQAIRFMDEFPDFKFSQSQASCYAAIEKYEPDLFRDIQRAVRAGKWNVVGGTWTESDTNLSSGEALSRSFLLAQRYFAAKLGVRARVGWLPDGFGHVAQLPQILQSAGIEYFYHMRTSPPNVQLYWWEGPDGSRVLAKTGQGYSDRVTPAVRNEPARLPPDVASQMFVYGVGDHGGGPTRRDIETALSFGKSPLYPRIQFSSADEYFDRVKPRAAKLPVHRGELQFIFEGCYTSVSHIKKGNRDLENDLQSAEAVATASLLTGKSWPSTELTEAWRTLVFNEFHDILPGSAIHESNLDSRARYFHASNIVRNVHNGAMRAVAERINLPRIPNDTMPVVVFNPVAWLRSDVVVAELVLTTGPLNDVVVTDDNGNVVSAQIVRTRQFDADIHIWVQFTALDVPGVGYRTFYVRPLRSDVGTLSITHWASPYPDYPDMQSEPASVSPSALIERNGLTISNRFAQISFDSKVGTIKSLRPRRKDGAAGRNILARRGANRLVVYLERAHGMSAWNIDPAAKGPFDVTVVTAARIVQEGPESIAVRSEYEWGRSRFVLTTTIHADTPRIDSHLVVEWLEKGTGSTDAPMLKVQFAVPGKPRKLHCDVPFAVVDRPTCREVPAQKWVDVEAGGSGLALMNTGKYGHSLAGGTLELTLLRSSYDPDVLPDIGRHEIEWAILPHRGNWQAANLPREGLAYNVPLRAFQARAQKGTLPRSHSFVTVEGSPAFVVTGIKKAETGRALIVRGYNASNRKTKVRLVFDRRVRAVKRVNILEEAETGAVRAASRAVTFPAGPWQIVSVRVTL